MSADDISPFGGLGFGYGWSTSHIANLIEDWSGFALGFMGGVTFFRTSNIHLDLEAAYRMIFDETREGDYPGAFSLAVGLYF